MGPKNLDNHLWLYGLPLTKSVFSILVIPVMLTHLDHHTFRSSENDNEIVVPTNISEQLLKYVGRTISFSIQKSYRHLEFLLNNFRR